MWPGAHHRGLNDNLKLDTGTLTYENLVGKTTQSSTTAGIDWKYSPEERKDKGNTGSGNALGGASKTEKKDSQSEQGGTSSKSEEQKRTEAKKRPRPKNTKMYLIGWPAFL